MSETKEVTEKIPAGGIGQPSDTPEGLEMDAAFQEGMRYLTGDGDVDASEETALRCFLRAVALGSIPALVNAGMLYERKEQYDEALELYEKAAAAGSADGAYNIAMMYLAGRGVRKDPGKARELLQQLYDCGMRGMVCLWLGDFEREGVFGDPDYDKALFYYEDGMRDGCGACFNQAGYMFVTGQGIEKDVELGLRCFHRAAELGDITAYGNLGEVYETGEGTEKDMDKALAYYRMGAEHGDQYSRIALARLQDERLDLKETEP